MEIEQTSLTTQTREIKLLRPMMNNFTPSTPTKSSVAPLNDRDRNEHRGPQDNHRNDRRVVGCTAIAPNCADQWIIGLEWTTQYKAEEAVHLSMSSIGAWLDELKNMIQSKTIEEQNSSTLGEVTKKERATTASMTAQAVNTLGEEMQREQTATANAITTMGCDVRRVVTKVDVIEEEVCAAKKASGENNNESGES